MRFLLPALALAALPLAAQFPIPIRIATLVLEETQAGQTDLLLMGEYGGTPRNVTATPDYSETFWNIAGGRVIYLRRTATGAWDRPYDVLSVRPDGSGTVRLLANVALNPNGSLPLHLDPGTGRVVGCQALPDGTHEIRSCLPDGSLPALLRKGSPGHDVALRDFGSVGGVGKAFYEYRYGPTDLDLYAVNADGSGTTALASSVDEERYAAFDGDRTVVYQRVSGGQNDVWAVEADGMGARAVANNTGQDELCLGASKGRAFIRSQVGAYQHLHIANLATAGQLPVVLWDAMSFYEAYACGDRLIYSRFDPSTRKVLTLHTASLATGGDARLLWTDDTGGTGALPYVSWTEGWGDRGLLVIQRGFDERDALSTRLDGTGSFAFSTGGKLRLHDSRPDGTFYMTTCTAADGGGQIRLDNVQTGAQSLLTTGAAPCYWGSVYGSSLYYTADEGGTNVVYRADATVTATPTRLRSFPTQVRVRRAHQF